MNRNNPYAELTPQKREEIILEHAPQIKRIVTRMAARFPPGVDQDELYQAGMLGLLDALDKFDSGKDVQFKTYAEFRIKGSILDELREMDWVPRSVRAASNEWEAAWREKASELGRDPSDQVTLERGDFTREIRRNTSDHHGRLISPRQADPGRHRELGRQLGVAEEHLAGHHIQRTARQERQNADGQQQRL